jgi:hypothetical protein
MGDQGRGMSWGQGRIGQGVDTRDGAQAGVSLRLRGRVGVRPRLGVRLFDWTTFQFQVRLPTNDNHNLALSRG